MIKRAGIDIFYVMEDYESSSGYAYGIHHIDIDVGAWPEGFYSGNGAALSDTDRDPIDRDIIDSGRGAGRGGAGNRNKDFQTPLIPPMEKIPQVRIDCGSSAVANSTNILNALSSTYPDYPNQSVKPNIDELKKHAQNQANEYGVSIGFGNGDYFMQNQNNSSYFASGTTNEVGIYADINTHFLAHTHPAGTNPAPSPSDAITIATNYYKYPWCI